MSDTNRWRKKIIVTVKGRRVYSETIDDSTHEPNPAWTQRAGPPGIAALYLVDSERLPDAQADFQVIAVEGPTFRGVGGNIISVGDRIVYPSGPTLRAGEVVELNWVLEKDDEHHLHVKVKADSGGRVQALRRVDRIAKLAGR